MNNGYAICPNGWLFDKEIKNELPLLLYISSLSKAHGYCDASNEHFALKFGISERAVICQIRKLINKKYIAAEYKQTCGAVRGRIITLPRVKFSSLASEVERQTLSSIYKYNKRNKNNTSVLFFKEKKKNIKKENQIITAELKL